jgi:uncharacterized glyoxalase superfamily protein PhnB
MKKLLIALLAAAMALPAAGQVGEIKNKEMKMTSVKKVTPVLYVEEIEPCLKFWERLGFQKTAEVPDGDKLGFAMLQKDGTELMYQSFASQEKDLPGFAKQFRGPTFLYIEVASLDEVRSALKGVKAELAERTTFYGAREIGYRDPAGHVVLFAEFGKGK